MGYLYPDKKVEELSDIEIMEDYLMTQNKIEADLRAILARLEDEEYGERAKDGEKSLRYYTTKLNRNMLTRAFSDACLKYEIHPYLDESLRNIDSDMMQAWVKYEHFLYPPYTDLVLGAEAKLGKHESWRLRDKYTEYNRCVMPYFDFFKKTNDEKTEILFGNLKKRLTERKPLTKEEYDKLKRGDIVAVTLAAYGAMGEPGVMNIATKNMDLFGVDLSTYIRMGNKYGLGSVFDAYGVPSLELMQKGEVDAEEWHYYYTGFGNVLCVDKKYYQKADEYIIKTLGKKWSCPDLYSKRFDVIEYAIVNTKRTKKK